MTGPAVERVLEALRAQGKTVRDRVRFYSCQCPVHDDTRPSLDVRQGDRGVLLACRSAGCTAEAIVEALGLTMPQLFDDWSPNGPPPKASARGATAASPPEVVYPYHDEDGQVVYAVVRQGSGPGKTFHQKRADGNGGWITGPGCMDGVRRVPYRLPAVIDAVERKDTVFVVEGEKDVHALLEHRATATTNPEGQGKWKPEYNQFFKGATVIIVADKDTLGYEHARHIEQELTGVASFVTVVEALEGKDAADHLAAGHGVNDFVPAADAAEAPGEVDVDVEPRGNLPTPLESSVPVSITYPTLGDYLADPSILEPPRALIPRTLYAGRLSMLAGTEKLGKSTYVAAGVAAATSGSFFLSEPTTAVKVVYVTIDEPVASTVANLARFGADHGTHVITDVHLGSDRIVGIANMIRILKPDGVVIDALWKLAAGKVDRSSDSSSWTGVLDALTGMAHDSDTGVLFTHHARKSDQEYRDSSAIGAAVDLILTMKRGDAGTTTRKIEPRGRWPIEPFTVALVGDTNDYRAHLGYTLYSGEELSLDARIVLHAQANPGISKTKLAQAAGGRKTEAMKRIDDLAARGAIRNDGTELDSHYVATAGAGELTNFA